MYPIYIITELVYICIAILCNQDRRMSRWHRKMEDRVSYYGTMQKGWNGYDAPPIPQVVLRRTFDLLFKMRYSSNWFWFEYWELSPTGRMSVQLECTVNGNYMEVEIYEDRYVIYIERDHSEQTVYNGATVVSTIKKNTPIKFLNIFRLRSIW